VLKRKEKVDLFVIYSLLNALSFMKKITNISRFLIAFSAITMLGAYSFPLWRIDLWAPQYPEGLSMQIWHNRLAGDVDIINGLNHYIGMRHIEQEMFPEFKILPYLIIFFVAFGLVVSAVGKRGLLTAYLVTMIVAGIVALGDFYRWGYDYGHNLDPNAAIKVPGMSYQPPIIGYKALLNFGAYSIPDIGGWLFIGAGWLVALVVFYEYYINKKQTPLLMKIPSKTPQKTALKIALSVSSILFLMSCSSEIEPINYGKEACHFCKMTIIDAKFGTEIITKKGKVYKFDDLHCLVNYMKENKINEADLAHIVVNDFKNERSFLPVYKAYFVKSDQFKSPMRGDIAAFKSEAVAEKSKPNNAQIMSWAGVFGNF
jgi:copper chaperone NosL